MSRTQLAIALCSLLVASVLLSLHPLIGVFDSFFYWGAIQVFLQGGDPYSFEALGSLLNDSIRHIPHSQHIIAHPGTLTFMLPFYAWPFPIAKFLLTFTSLAVYLSCVKRLQRLWRPLPACCVILMWGYIPFLTALYFGQFSIFLALGTVLALEWVESSSRPWWKWALAMGLYAIKPQSFVVAAPLLILEFLRTSSRRDRILTLCCFVLMTALTVPMLAYLPNWLQANQFMYQHTSATLSSYVRDWGTALGYESGLWLWALPAASLLALLGLRVRITNSISLLFVLTLSQLTAPYVWVYDSCALMPMFYALIGAIGTMREPRWRWHLGVIFTSISVFPIYLAIDADFSFMRMHNVCLGIAAVLLLTGVRRYLKQ